MRPTNATFGFATMLRKLLQQRKPDAVAVCFDRPEKTFRHEMDPEYKATRSAMPDDLVPQVADVKALCRAMGLAVVEEPGFEADDLIGTLAEKGARAGLVVEVVSADKDLFQLVREGAVSVWYFREGRLIAVDAVNDAKAYVVGKKLIEMGRTPDRAALEDPAADLKALTL